MMSLSNRCIESVLHCAATRRFVIDPARAAQCVRPVKRERYVNLAGMIETVPLAHSDVLQAAARIAPHCAPTPLLTSHSLDALSGARLFFKAEHLQRSGAFKFRGACNAVWSLPDERTAHGVVTHSSGNHGAALALAARTRGMGCHVVVPEGAVAAKLANISRHGATLWRCAPTIAAREQLCAEVQASSGATLVHPYTDVAVIAGQGTATLELLHQSGGLDVLVAPVGGGGLAAGAALALRCAPGCELVLAEPAGAADTARSLAAGQRLVDFCAGHCVRWSARHLGRAQFRAAAARRRAGDHSRRCRGRPGDAADLAVAQTSGRAVFGDHPWPRCWPSRHGLPGAGWA